MDKHEKEKLSKYGKLVWDFANGKTTDDILKSFFENLQSAFNFSNAFTKRALTKFPTKKMITGPLTSKEKELLEILTHRNKILKSCSAQLNHVYCDLDKYDPEKETFKIIARIYIEGIPDKNQDYIEDTHLVPKKEIEKFVREKTESYYDNSLDKDIFKDNIKVELESLANILHQIEEIKAETTNRFAEIEKVAEGYKEIIELHDYVKETQENLKRIISQIIKAANAYKSKGFKSILSRYNTIQKTKYIINNEHKLVEIGPFSEDYFFAGDLLYYKEHIFNAPISFCLIEFLKNPEYSGKERIADCQDCNCIFSKAKLNDRQHYCPICSKKNHTPKDKQAERTRTSRAAKKKIKDKEKRKLLYVKQYQRLIQAGYSKKQAQQESKEYVIEQMPVIE